MVTDTRTAELAALRPVLEQQYERHTEQLAELNAQACSGEDTDPAATAALLASCRKSLADVAGALRHLADGSYGDCIRCGRPIPIERLQWRPQATRCVSCQQRA